MTCALCHTEDRITRLRKCRDCGKWFCVDCGSHETRTCCECLRDEDTCHNQDFGRLISPRMEDLLDESR